MDFRDGHNCLMKLSQQIMENDKGNNLVIYKGVFDKMPFSIIETYCEQLTQETLVVRKKIRTVFVEMAQNINFYSAEKNNGYGVGYISVNRSENGYTIVSGNLTNSYNYNRLKERVKKVEKLDNQSLHILKQKLLLESGFELTENANIGVVQCTIAANSPYQYNFEQISDNEYFVMLKIEVKIPR